MCVILSKFCFSVFYSQPKYVMNHLLSMLFNAILKFCHLKQLCNFANM